MTSKSRLSRSGKQKSGSRRKSTDSSPDISRRDRGLSDTSRPRGVSAARDRLTPKIELSAPDNRRSIDDEPDISRRDLERDPPPSTRSTLRRQAERESASEESNSEDDRVLLRTSLDIDGRDDERSRASDDGLVKKATKKQLDELRHFSRPNPFLKGRRAEIRPMLTTLFDTLGCDFDTAISIKTSLYSLKEAELKRLRKDLDDAWSGDSKALRSLLTRNNPINRVLLKNPDTFRRILNKFTNTEDSHANIEAIENSLVTSQDAAMQRGEFLDLGLTPPIHEICFRKKTEILEDVIEGLVADTDKPGLQALKAIKKENYWKILIDGKAHEHNDKHFYDRSKGFMASMMKGLSHIVEAIDRPLDTDFVLELQKDATELVTLETLLDPNIPIGSSKFQETGIKKAPNAWGVTKQYTEDGMTELATLRQELDDVVGGGYFSDGELNFPDREPDRVVQWKAGNPNQTKEELQATVKSLMDHVTTKANRKISEAEDQDEVIGAIIDCCRGLGIIHPFKDANGRLFMFLVLNKLLMEQGMPPTILSDQGLMVGKSKAELIALIKAGQRQVTGEDEEDEDIPPPPSEDED